MGTLTRHEFRSCLMSRMERLSLQEDGLDWDFFGPSIFNQKIVMGGFFDVFLSHIRVIGMITLNW